MISQKAKESREQLVKDLCEAMKNGTAPWQQPWSGDMETPFNAVSGRHYRGVNFVRLSMRGSQMGQSGSIDPRWCTFEQAKEKGWHIKPGSKGTKVEFYKFDEKLKTDEFGDLVLDEEGKQEVQRSVIVRNYVVFHASQIEGIEPYEPKISNAVECNEKAERILKESGADIRHGGNEAYYSFNEDAIHLPKMEQFNSQADYYATALHELTHWTGNPSRLNREMSGDRHSETYAREGLVAEISSMFVSAETGIQQTKEHFANHASYVDYWIKAVEKDPNALFRAVSQAQKASEEILKHERVREQGQNQSQPETEKQGAHKTEHQKPDDQRTAARSASGGDPVPLSALTEKAIRDLKLVDGEPKIFLHPRLAGQTYKGEVRRVDEEHRVCFQKVGKQSLVLHHLEKIEGTPKVGEAVKIAYDAKGEKAKLSVQEEKRHRGLHR